VLDGLDCGLLCRRPQAGERQRDRCGPCRSPPTRCPRRQYAGSPRTCTTPKSAHIGLDALFLVKAVPPGNFTIDATYDPLAYLRRAVWPCLLSRRPCRYSGTRAPTVRSGVQDPIDAPILDRRDWPSSHWARQLLRPSTNARRTPYRQRSCALSAEAAAPARRQAALRASARGCNWVRWPTH
jgi:hypothetical protein